MGNASITQVSSFGLIVCIPNLCIHLSPGDLEVNEEAFVDWDEDCHGPMDTSENRRQWPENFTWSCCEEDGTAEGCEVGEHEPEQAQDRRKRARYQ